MVPALCADQAPVPPPAYHRGMAAALHLDVLTLVRGLHLLALCRQAVQLAWRQCPPPTWTAAELGKRTSVERFFARVLVYCRLQRPPLCGWSAVETRVALTYAATWVIALAAWQHGRPTFIRSPRLVLAHVWEGVEL